MIIACLKIQMKKEYNTFWKSLTTVERHIKTEQNEMQISKHLEDWKNEVSEL